MSTEGPLLVYLCRCCLDYGADFNAVQMKSPCISKSLKETLERPILQNARQVCLFLLETSKTVGQSVPLTPEAT